VTARTFRWIRSGALPGGRNMAIDETLLLAEPAPRPCLRLYRWRPWTLSLGWFQRVSRDEIEPFLAAGHGVTRRATGGGAIFHGDELTYSLVLPADDPRLPASVADSYHWIHGAVAAALAECGVAARPRGDAPAAEGPDPFFCFARTAAIDLVAGGRKLVGSAQRRTRTAVLQHGSIPLTATVGAPGATSVADASGRAADADALEAAMGAAFARLLDAAPEPSAMAPEEEEDAARRDADRFGNLDWVLHPWRGRAPSGRTTSPLETGLPPLPPARAAIRVLRASVADGTLRVEAVAGGGARPALPLAELRSVSASPGSRVSDVPLSPDRDPWDSTFRRSHFPGAGEGEAPAVASVRTVECSVTLGFADGTVLLLDGRRFNYAALGAARTGRWREDLALLLGEIAGAAPPGVAAAALAAVARVPPRDG
jgi:lipoate-protein ligase A